MRVLGYATALVVKFLCMRQDLTVRSELNMLTGHMAPQVLLS